MKHLLRNRPFRPSLIGTSKLSGVGGGAGGGGVYTEDAFFEVTNESFGGTGAFNGTFDWTTDGFGRRDVTIEKSWSADVDGRNRLDLAYTTATIGTWNVNAPRVIQLLLNVSTINLVRADDQDNLLIGVWFANAGFGSAYTSPEEGYYSGVQISPVYGGTAFDGYGQARGISPMSDTNLIFLTSSASAQDFYQLRINVQLLGGRLRYYQSTMQNMIPPSTDKNWVVTGDREKVTAQPQSVESGNINVGVFFGSNSGQVGTYEFVYQLKHAIHEL